ncbi:MAG: ATP-binding protein [Planctomycetota bacterium]
MERTDELIIRISSLGEAAIDELIVERQSEQLFLDFKRSSDNASGTRLSDADRGNLAKAISGFGNSEGGIVIWGVDCRPNQQLGDVAAAKVKIQNPRRFKSWLESAVSGLTIPPHPGVRHVVVEDGTGAGFVVTHIPKSYLAPHQCLRPIHYYMRVGSNFEPVPHGVLAGMFGRSPQPVIFHMWNAPPAEFRPGDIAWFRIGLLLTNRSPAIARDVYLSVMILPPGANSRIAVEFPDLQNWSANQAFGCITQVLAKEGFRLAPHVVVQPITLVFWLVPPFPERLLLKITTGCAGSPIKEFTHRLSPEELQVLYEAFFTEHGSEQARREFVRQIVGGRADNEEAGTYEEQ